jgi:hypothetical protein
LLPPDLASLAMPPAREFHARKFLGSALACLKAGKETLAARFLFEALALDPDVPGRPEFAEILKQPNGALLRHRIRNYILHSIAE